MVDKITSGSETENSPLNHQCPCCDYFTLPERGDYLICPVCFWEDDGQDMDKLDVRSAPNRDMTLREGRRNFLNFGACEQSMRGNVCSADERSVFKFLPR